MDANTLLGGRYQLTEIIGTGGMSDVYAGTDTLLGRDVAIKMMRADLARDATFLERFRREALNAAKLNHHAIVAVYDTGQTSEEDGSVPYIVMERVRGRTLRDIVREDGPLQPEYAATVMADVAAALQFSHEAGIIHRDIKPANIMITSTGSVKVMDFGIARALGDATSSMTQTAAVIGTAQYLSPEQARGRSADPRSDIYSAGCVFYELLTGRPPFQGESPFSVAYQHVQDDPVPPSRAEGVHWDQPLATHVDAVVLTAMAKDPADRYENASDFAADLRCIAEHRVPLAAKHHVEEAPTTVFPAPAGGFSEPGGAHAAPATPQGSTPVNTAYHNAAPPQGQQRPRHGEPATQPVSPAPSRPVQPAPAPPIAQIQESERQDEDAAVRRWTKIIWSLVLVALLAVGGYGAWAYFQGHSLSSQQSSQVAIPDVKGLSEEDATAKLEQAGLKVVTTQNPSTDVEKGHAIGTSPAIGSHVRKNSQVTLSISSGKEVTEVPDLTGKDTAEAAKILEDSGLTLDQTVKEASSDTVPKGKIIEQSPSSGSQVSRGSKVTITVSTGVETVRVPAVTGQSISDARGNLEGAGFVVQVIEADSAEPQGKVLGVSNEREQLPKGSTVQVTVSRGNQITMPSITGQTYDQALDSLHAAGWTGDPSKLTQHPQNTKDVAQVGKVISQSVPAGQVTGKDATVDVGVGAFSILP